MSALPRRAVKLTTYRINHHPEAETPLRQDNNLGSPFL